VLIPKLIGRWRVFILHGSTSQDLKCIPALAFLSMRSSSRSVQSSKDPEWTKAADRTTVERYGRGPETSRHFVQINEEKAQDEENGTNLSADTSRKSPRR
jgi:hypothetical protein